MDLLYFNSRMLLSFNFIFSFKTFPEVFPLKENSIIQLWTISLLFIKLLFMWWKSQKSFRVIFAKSRLFFCFLLGVKRVFSKNLYFICNFLFLKWVKNPSTPPVSLAHLRPGGSVKPTGHSPRSPLSFLSPEIWRLRRPAAAVLNSDGLHRS
jgi:hypothetical protein